MTEHKDGLGRIPTGIEGLDDAMEGGFLKNSINVVAGGPGSGKSIFAMQYLITGANKYNEPGVYITFEEKIDRIEQYMHNFGWDIKKMIAEKKLGLFEQSPLDVKKAATSELFNLKYKVVRELKAKRLVIDSMSAYSLLFTNNSEMRAAHSELFDMLRSWGVTVLLTAEYDVERHVPDPLDFEADSIIWLYNSRRTDVRTRALEVFKMRGSKHLQKTFPLELSENGVVIYPEQSIF